MTSRTTPERPADRWRGDLRALGLAGFALPLFVASFVWTGFYASDRILFALPLALIMGATTAAASGVSYRYGDSFSGTMLGTLGAFWLSWGALQWMTQAGVIAIGADHEAMLALFFAGWAGVTVLIAIAAWQDMLVDVLILTGTALTFAGLALGYGMARTDWLAAAGWMGLVTVALAAYTVLADLLNYNLRRNVLPVMPLGHAAIP